MLCFFCFQWAPSLDHLHTESLVEGQGLVEILGGDGHVGVAEALDDIVGHDVFSFQIWVFRSDGAEQNWEG